MIRADFNDLISQYSRKLYRFAYTILRDQEDAEDAVQEVFIKLWNMKDNLEKYESIEALLITMTKHFCLDMLRKRKRMIDFKDQSNKDEMVDDPTPHERLEQDENKIIIFEIIDKLPDNYKNIVLMHEIEGLSYEEISVKTNQSVNNLRVLISRAREKIRVEYKRYQYEYNGTQKPAGKVL